MNSNTTPTPRTNQARHTAFNGQKTDYEAYLYMAYVAETIEIELAEKTNEVSNYHQHYRDEASKAQKCKQAFIEQEKEVARLREVCEWAADMMDGISPTRGQEIRDAIQKPHNQ